MNYNGGKCNERTTINETLGNLIKQSTQQRGKRRTKRKDPSPSQNVKIESRSQRSTWTNYVPKPPSIVRSISKKEREGNLKE